MIAIRYVIGALGFLVVGGIVAIFIGMGMLFFFPADHGEALTHWNWRMWPGEIFGLLAGIQSFRSAIRGPERPNRLMQGFTLLLGASAVGLAVFVAYTLHKYM